MGSRRRLLVTGAGAPGIRGTIYALKNNEDRKELYLVGCDINPEAVGRYFTDAFYQLPAPEDPDYIDRLLSVCRKEGIEGIIPQTTREIAVLSHAKELFNRQGLRVLVSDGMAIDVANNKYRLLQQFKELGLPCPQHGLATTEAELVELASAFGYPKKPVVVKVPESNGMRGLRILKEEAWDLERFLCEKPSGIEIPLQELIGILHRGKAWVPLLVCEYLPGPEYSVDAFFGRDICLAVPRLRKSIRSGISFDNLIERREDLIDQTTAAGRAIGLQYAVGFQYKVDLSGTGMILECNPRVQGTMVASLFGGVNIIWLAIKELFDEPVTERAICSFTPGRFVRFWGGIGIVGGEIVEI